MIRTLKNLFHYINASLASFYYRYPGRELIVIGITGTDGKTTTTHILYQILKNAGKKVSMISTVKATINSQDFDTGFHVTTPSPWKMQKFMSQALKNGSEYFILETTSHALDQHRIRGCMLDVALITNISHEHLDYHGTFDNYLKAKCRIFEGVAYSVINMDDEHYKQIKKSAHGKIITYSLGRHAQYSPSSFGFKTGLIGYYNVINCLAAATVAKILNIGNEDIKKGISDFKGLKGRMEEIKTRNNFRIYIDFAHKPNAMENALRAVRKMSKGKIISVFGCAGLRDRIKRPMMGQISQKYSDYVILTAEDPRTEDVRKITEEIISGFNFGKISEANKKDKRLKQLVKGRKYFWRIPDRQEAINFALRYLAKKDDLVILFGKGHEKSMCYGRTEYPWDEKMAVNKALYDTVQNTS